MKGISRTARPERREVLPSIAITSSAFASASRQPQSSVECDGIERREDVTEMIVARRAVPERQKSAQKVEFRVTEPGDIG